MMNVQTICKNEDLLVGSLKSTITKVLSLQNWEQSTMTAQFTSTDGLAICQYQGRMHPSAPWVNLTAITSSPGIEVLTKVPEVRLSLDGTAMSADAKVDVWIFPQ